MANETIANKPADVKQPTMADIMAFLASLDAKIDALGTSIQTASGPRSRSAAREMTEDDARKVLTDLADLDHAEAAAKLGGLSYGQVYSVRGGYTFKGVKADLKKAGVVNRWLKD